MVPPLIGITTYGREPGNRFSLPAEYAEAVRRGGGIPLLVPPGEPHLPELLCRLDGLILAGGGDVDPSHYRGSPHESIYNVDAERDATEIALAREAVRCGVPTLGICRGAQVINVALGGTLIEHLPDVVGEAVPHRLPPRQPARHPVVVQPASRLAEILYCPAEINPASWHHQAIRQAAPCLAVVAHAPDGAIEAVEMLEHPWLIAVQWHPELTASDDPTQQRLFDDLIKAAAALRAKRDSGRIENAV